MGDMAGMIASAMKIVEGAGGAKSETAAAAVKRLTQS